MYEQWIESRVSLAERLAAGQCGGSSAEAYLILSSLISGVAADLWPGDNLDRKRFVELWARFADPNLRANLVSVPLLIHSLDERQMFPSSDRLRLANKRCFMPRGLPDCLVVTGEDVDLSEQEVAQIVPELSLSEIRKWSYANVFYVQLRSSYVHEYQAGTHVDEIVMSDKRSHITYGNFVDSPHRRINFDVSWVAAVVRSSINQASPEWSRRPLRQPAGWWIAGAA